MCLSPAPFFLPWGVCSVSWHISRKNCAHPSPACTGERTAVSYTAHGNYLAEITPRLQIKTIQLILFHSWVRGIIANGVENSPVTFTEWEPLKKIKSVSGLTWFSAGGLWGWGRGLSPSYQGALYCHGSEYENIISQFNKCQGECNTY